MSGQNFDEAIEKACKDSMIPGAVLVGGNTSGKYHYAKAFGKRSLQGASPEPMTLDSCMWIASCTKLVTTVAAMQCVEKGLLKLDNDVTDILHELRGAKILIGFNEDSGEPELVENTKIITLRHLLTHSSGLGYDAFNPLLAKYTKWQGKSTDRMGTVPPQEGCLFPLLFEPGVGWEYGVGIDWAGQMVERVNNNISLEDYMRENIWGLLGVNNFTFHPKTVPALSNNMAGMHIRAGGVHPLFGVSTDPDGKVIYTSKRYWGWEVPGCYGGGGGFTNMVDYHKLLHSICVSDGKLLQVSTIDEMFRPQLTSTSRTMLMRYLSIPEINTAYACLPVGTKVDWGLGGQIIMEDLVRERRKGTMVWGGMPGLNWFCDRSGKMSGIFGTQIMPHGDVKAAELFKSWVKEMYSWSRREKL